MSAFFLEGTALHHAGRPAVIAGDGTLSYSDFTERVLAAAVRLSAQNIQRGDRIAVLASPSPHALVGIMALLRLGAVVVPVSVRFPSRQIARMLDGIECSAVLVSREYTGLAADTSLRTLPLEEHTTGTGNGTSPVPWPGTGDATVIFTSGSTGSPRAALHTLDAHLASALGSQQNIPLQPGDCWLLSLPLFHVGGFAVPVRAFQAGASVALAVAGATIPETLRRFPITHLSLVATQLYRLLRDKEHVQLLRGLKAILLGGSAMPRTLISRALDAGLRIHTSYGCTEMASQVTTTREQTAEELATSGRLLPFRELAIADTGEIVVRGKTLFRGYVEGREVRSAVDSDGWYHTRDTGFLDAEGRLHVTGRIDNMFVSGGENIQPEEIEQALCCIPGILQSLVVPVDDEEFGARPVAFVWTTDGAAFDEKEVRSQLAGRIARFKMPVRFVPGPPLEEHAGKLNREEYKRKAKEL